MTRAGTGQDRTDEGILPNRFNGVIRWDGRVWGAGERGDNGLIGWDWKTYRVGGRMGLENV